MIIDAQVWEKDDAQEMYYKNHICVVTKLNA